MIQLGMREHLEARTDGAAFGVVAAVDDAGDARLDDGTGAHAARFDRDVERRPCEAVVSNRARCFTQHHDFGVRRRVAVADRAIRATGCDDASGGAVSGRCTRSGDYLSVHRVGNASGLFGTLGYEINLVDSTESTEYLKSFRTIMGYGYSLY